MVSSPSACPFMMEVGDRYWIVEGRYSGGTAPRRWGKADHRSRACLNLAVRRVYPSGDDAKRGKRLRYDRCLRMPVGEYNVIAREEEGMGGFE